MIFIIILNWNDAQNTVNCVQSIKKSNYKTYKIILIDNGSNDRSLNELINTLDCLNIQYTKCKTFETNKKTLRILSEDLNIENSDMLLVENSNNIGFSAGVNIGIQLGLEKCAKYVMLLNNDTTLQNDSLDLLIDFFNQRKQLNIAAATPLIIKENDKTIWSAGAYVNFYGKLNRKAANKNAANLNAPFTVDFITNCASIYPIETFKTIGLISENSFMGADDMEFSLRMKNNNISLYCVPNSIVIHKVGESFSNNEDLNLMYTNYLPSLIFYRKYLGFHYWFIWALIYTIAIVKNYIFTNILTMQQSTSLILNLIKLTFKTRKYDKELHFTYLKNKS